MGSIRDPGTGPHPLALINIKLWCKHYHCNLDVLVENACFFFFFFIVCFYYSLFDEGLPLTSDKQAPKCIIKVAATPSGVKSYIL